MTDSGKSEEEAKQLRATALETATTVLQIRALAEQEIRQTNEILEKRTRELSQALVVMRATLESTTDAIILALHEAVSNVIRHAHRDVPGASLQIACALDDERIEIHLRDEGEPFDLAAVPSLNPAEMRLGGRGVFLMRTLMDELHCEPLPEKGNHLRMVKYRTRNPRYRERG